MGGDVGLVVHYIRLPVYLLERPRCMLGAICFVLRYVVRILDRLRDNALLSSLKYYSY